MAPDTVRSPSKAGADSELDEKRSLDSSKGELDSLPQGVEADGSYNPAVVGHPWRVKGPAIFCVLLLTFGKNFTSSSISPLKSTLKKELGIDNAQYANIDTADSLINTIFPILSGCMIDYIGPSVGALYSCSIILIGALLTAGAASAGNYGLMLFAQIIFGFGSSTLETSQSKLYAFYTLGSSMQGAIFGLDIAMGRVFNLCGKLSSVPIMERANSYAMTFWVAAIFAGVSFALATSFFFYERTFHPSARVPTGRQAARDARARGEDVVGAGSHWKANRLAFLRSIWAIPAAFFLLDISQLFQSGAVGSYTSNLADTIRVTRGATLYTAGYTSALSQVMPIVLTPLLGVFFDRFGMRMHWVTWTASLWCVVFALLAYTTVHPLVPALLGSLALATNVLPWIASIPLLVPDQAHLGTAFGIYKAASPLNNCGSVIVNTASGAIQDRAKADKNQYNNVFAFLLVIKGLDVIYGLCYWRLDKRYLGGVLQASDARLREMEATQSPEERTAGVRRPIKAVTIVALATVASMVVTAWVLYLYYSV
ncbi:hypothetical protein Rhopal_003575-T1 [Rhodotorula paludigena]|uniref:Lysosomal dipeptide transporter MFSD1 n=1 Tax=Rhodotorula paludigena TaxID=86838 RepID=A0AAV5GPH0_9BASI|nr:hypothetical protein Rhopal_003575-T1 [Rhodotorula paludigena]